MKQKSKRQRVCLLLFREKSYDAKTMMSLTEFKTFSAYSVLRVSWGHDRYRSMQSWLLHEQRLERRAPAALNPIWWWISVFS